MTAIEHYKEGERNSLETIIRKLNKLIGNHPNIIPIERAKDLVTELTSSRSEIDNTKLIQG